MSLQYRGVAQFDERDLRDEDFFTRENVPPTQKFNIGVWLSLVALSTTAAGGGYRECEKAQRSKKSSKRTAR